MMLQVIKKTECPELPQEEQSEVMVGCLNDWLAEWMHEYMIDGCIKLAVGKRLVLDSCLWNRSFFSKNLIESSQARCKEYKLKFFYLSKWCSWYFIIYQRVH